MSLLRVGIVGVVISALCCFTPILVTLFGIVGLAAWVGYLDYVLMPSLLFFLALTIFAMTQRYKEKSPND